MTKHQVYLGLGTNQGDRQSQLQTAIRLIDQRVGTVTRQSHFIDTEPWGFQSEHRFLNAVVLCETVLTPREVLELTQGIERDMGRSHKTTRLPSGMPVYADRPIDIDILFYDDLMVDEPDLKIPHPLMYERDFVMIPLREIYPLTIKQH